MQAEAPKFSRRARSVISNAALYQLVEEMAVALDAQGERLSEIHAMCIVMMHKLAEKE